MESKLIKMMKLAPNVADSLEKINFITSIPKTSAIIPSGSFSVAATQATIASSLQTAATPMAAKVAVAV